MTASGEKNSERDEEKREIFSSHASLAFATFVAMDVALLLYALAWTIGGLVPQMDYTHSDANFNIAQVEAGVKNSLGLGARARLLSPRRSLLKSRRRDKYSSLWAPINQQKRRGSCQ